MPHLLKSHYLKNLCGFVLVVTIFISMTFVQVIITLPLWKISIIKCINFSTIKLNTQIYLTYTHFIICILYHIMRSILFFSLWFYRHKFFNRSHKFFPHSVTMSACLLYDIHIVALHFRFLCTWSSDT